MTAFKDCWPQPCRDYHDTYAHTSGEDPCACPCHRPRELKDQVAADRIAGRIIDHLTSLGLPPQGAVPGLDTPASIPQTDDMRSTTGLPHDFGQVCDCIDCVGCDHKNVEPDDDGLLLRFNRCTDCDRVVVLTAPDEDGQSFWEVIDA